MERAWPVPCVGPKTLVTASDRAGFIVATRSIAFIALCAVLVPSRLLAQASVYYVYDDLNRLVAVVDQQGNAATYTYDAVGNILKIDRLDATGLPGGAAISMFAPAAGAVGTTVQVFGRGFGAGITQNSLLFGGRAATLVTAALIPGVIPRGPSARTLTAALTLRSTLSGGTAAATLTGRAARSIGNAGRIVTSAEALSVASSACVAVTVTTGGTGMTAGAV